MEEQTSSATTTVRPSSRPNARACRPCARGKVKCLPPSTPGSSHGKCERCHRLNKDCVVEVRVARKHRVTKTRHPTQLEEKLDGIVSLLASRLPPSSEQYPSPNSPPRGDQYPVSSGAQSISPNRQEDCGKRESIPPYEDAHLPHAALASAAEGYSKAQLVPTTSPLNAPHPQHTLPDTFLSLFRSRMVEHFPFVVVPPSMSVQGLRQEKPLLFLAISMATSFHDSLRQQSLGREVVESLSKRLLLQGEKSLDLLQGLLVFIAWYHYHFYNSPQMTNLLQLAIALMVDLGLNKEPRAPGTRNKSIELNWMFYTPQISGARSLDERRAFAGCFYLSSVFSASIKKLDALRYSQYLEECCQVLEDTREYDTDLKLVQLIRLQHLTEKICQSLPHHECDNNWISKAPVGMYVNSLKAELQTLKASLFPENLSSNSLLVHYYSVEMLLYEFGIYVTPTGGHCTFGRLEILYCYLLSTTSLLDSFISLPSATYQYVSVTTWAQVAIALLATFRLTSPALECDGWDLKAVRKTLDVPRMLDQLIRRLEPTNEDGFDNSAIINNEVFSQFRSRARHFQTCRERRISVEPEPELPSTHGAQSPAIPNDAIGVDLFGNLDDENFWKQIMSDWSFLQ